MTSERARIAHPQVRKPADEIIVAQRRAIAEMRSLIADAGVGDGVEETYRDPAAQPGTVQDALANTLICQLDLAPTSADEAAQVLGAAPACGFAPTDESDPFLWTTGKSGMAAAKLNGVLLSLEVRDKEDGALAYGAPGTTVTVLPLAEEAGGRADVDVLFELDQGLRVGYRGLYRCAAP